MMEENNHRFFAEIDRDTFLKFVELNKPNDLKADWLKSLVEHVCDCEKWREEQV